MTAEEIKQAFSMREVVERYGIRIKHDGMCCCPFHGEKHASMKIYKDSFHCFACGANGDIFTFIQNMDNCDFKTAFYSLGGTYEKQSDKARMIANSKRERSQNERKKKERAENEFKKEFISTLSEIRKAIKESEPFSDRWCLAQKYLPLMEEWWDCLYIRGEEVNMVNVYRVCRTARREINITF